MSVISWRAATLVLSAAALTVSLAVVTAGAGVADPEALTYRGGGRGTVLFDHQKHAASGFVCADCHGNFAGTSRQLFLTAQRGLIDRAAHDGDGSCFACHNGRSAFDKCDDCHRQF